jgi:hypothetical protein
MLIDKIGKQKNNRPQNNSNALGEQAKELHQLSTNQFGHYGIGHKKSRKDNKYKVFPLTKVHLLSY